MKYPKDYLHFYQVCQELRVVLIHHCWSYPEGNLYHERYRDPKLNLKPLFLGNKNQPA